MKFYDFIKFFKEYRADLLVFLVACWVVLLVAADLATGLLDFKADEFTHSSNPNPSTDHKQNCVNIDGLTVCD